MVLAVIILRVDVVAVVRLGMGNMTVGVVTVCVVAVGVVTGCVVAVGVMTVGVMAMRVAMMVRRSEERLRIMPSHVA